MKDLSIKEFSDLVYEKLEKLYKNKPILSNPNTESKFPILELHTPLKSVNLTENAFPIKSTFQISITCWNEKQRQAMQMTDEVDKKLQELNFTRTNTSPAVYDSILQKYGITTTFEVRYNSITSSFNLR
ncbi:MAG TPA: hypothetical protein OIM45_04800 [Clostridiaceae bacterium]|jgi:hypothetical protein|nr:hypothetical protein [Clostridiaceae bacterium]